MKCPPRPIVRLFLRIALLVTAAITWPSYALAQQVDITANVDATEIELGDAITYTLQASTSTSDAPSDPKLPTPPGFTLVDQGASPTHMVSIINGARSEKHGLTASWTFRSDRLGTFTIGPATVAFAGGRRNGTTQRVSVLPPGSGKARPRRPSRQPFDPFSGSAPFDPFKGIFPGVDDDAQNPVGALDTDPKLALDSPRAPVAFLHATIDKTRAVVGEQVTLNVYLYEDLNARQGRTSDVHEATAVDFVKRSLLQDETRAVHIGNANVGGRPWAVKLVRKNALFPLKTGRLAISPMSLTLPQARIGLRESETLYVEVSEPPVAGRPSGYQVGDTGDFSLSASIAPHEVDQNGAVGVTVELRGNGNMPASLPTPEIAGTEWLEPQTRDALGPVSSDVYGGTRTFSYVVRLRKAGAIDLGEIRLPYFDPRTRTYSVARAALGIVQVAPASTSRNAAPEVADSLLPGLPKPHPALEGKHEPSFLTERPWFWTMLVGSPLACVIAIVAYDTLRRARERSATTAPSPARIAREKHAEAEAAMRRDDGKAASAAIARAIESEILASTGVNLRGTAGDGALRELTDAGIPESTAKSVLDLLSRCEDARFSPSGVPIEGAIDLWKRAKTTIADVQPARRGRTSTPPTSRDELQ